MPLSRKTKSISVRTREKRHIIAKIIEGSEIRGISTAGMNFLSVISATTKELNKKLSPRIRAKMWVKNSRTNRKVRIMPCFHEVFFRKRYDCVDVSISKGIAIRNDRNPLEILKLKRRRHMGKAR